MTCRSSLASLSLVAASLALAASACSAVVAPDTTRLGIDSGIAQQNDAALVPGNDSGIPRVCGAGQIDCGGSCVQPASDPTHCGSCTSQCGAGQSCVSGVCTGGTTSLLGNPSDCGASHTRCQSLQICLAGACVCRTPYSDVGGTCIDLTSDPNNCGVPGHRCAGRCAGGTCIAGDCPTGLTSCDGACVDLRRDPGNCGDCGNVCRGSQVCIGSCRDVTVSTGCTSCPCTQCGGGAACCAYPGLDAPVCIDGIDFCPR